MSGIPTIQEIHSFSGHPGEFWPAFFAFTCAQAGAGRCILFERQDDVWKPRVHWPSPASQQPSADVIKQLSLLAGETLKSGVATTRLASPDDTVVFGLRLEEPPAAPCRVILLFAAGQSNGEREDVLRRLPLLADAPAIYQRARAARQREADLSGFADILDLLLLLNAEGHHLAAAMTLVNETVTRYRCSRVSLGWSEEGYIRLQAISHMERFERKMEIVNTLEAAMEEAFDQDEEILLPKNASGGSVVRDHEDYARRQQVPYLLSLPLRLSDRPVGVLTCERQDLPFSEDDVRSLRILCDQVACRLEEFRLRDRGLGARIKDVVRDKVSGLLGVEHTLIKFAGLLVFIVLLAAAVVRLPYRVEAPFILRSEDVRQVSVPFEGYIDNVHVRIGQQVAEQDLLLTLDARELLLEESAAVANQVRYLREVEKARASGSLVDMKIAQAQADQAGAQLELMRQRLAQAELRAPIAGFVVEGDLEQLRGAPVDKGDILFKVARGESLFVEIKVAEQDVHELAVGQPGEIAFVSRPHLKFSFTVDQVDPVAVTEESGNVFLARGKGLQTAETWWRPGMSGIAKVDVGRRSLLWIATHRTIDFFQMLMWW